MASSCSSSGSAATAASRNLIRAVSRLPFALQREEGAGAREPAGARRREPSKFARTHARTHTGVRTSHLSAAAAAPTTTPTPRFSPAPQVVASKHLAIVLLRDFRVLCLLLVWPLILRTARAPRLRVSSRTRMREEKTASSRGCRTHVPWVLPWPQTS